MEKTKQALRKLIDSEGFDGAKSLLGLNTIELIQKSDCPIDSVLANELIPKFFSEKVLPSRYKNCLLSYSKHEGLLEWDWSDEGYNDYNSEDTYTLATPFWDGNSGIPIDTSHYTALNSIGKEIKLSHNDIHHQDCYSHIDWDEEFNNLASYSMWIRRFYLPQVYSAIKEHLDNYRNYED